MSSPIGKTAKLCLGYALLVASEYMCLHSPTAFAVVDLPQALWSYYLITVLVTQLLVFVGGLFIHRSLQSRSRQLLVVATSIIMVVGVAAIFLMSRMGQAAFDPPYLVLLLIAIGIGIGLAIFNLCWARIFSRLDSKRLYRLVIISFLIGLVVYLPVTLMPHVTIVPVIIFLVLISAFLLASQEQAVEPGEPGEPGALGEPGEPGALGAIYGEKPVSDEPARAPRKPTAALGQPIRSAAQVLWRPVFCTAVFSFMSGLILMLSERESLPLGEFQQVSIIASLIVVAILLLPALLLSRPLDITSAYRISLPISAAGFLLLPFIFDALSGISIALVNMGLMTVSIVLWCMFAATTKATQLPAHLVFGAGMAITTLANLAGITLGLLQGAFLTQSVLMLAAVALVSVYLLSMLSLIIFKRQDPLRQAAVAEEEVTKSLTYSEEQYLECCKLIALAAGFTPREEEMLPLLGSGRSLARISELLFISTNTAKSHVKSIYLKLEVHSKQELMDLVHEKVSQQSAILTSNTAKQSSRLPANSKEEGEL